MVEITKINIFVDCTDLIFSIFQHSALVLFIAFNGGGRCLSHWKISLTCKTACTKDNKLFIWRKKKSRGGRGTIVKIKVKIPPCLAELVFYLTICSSCNLYCQSLEFKGVFYLQFVNVFSNIWIQDFWWETGKPTQQQLLRKAVHYLTYCVRNSCIVLGQLCPNQSKMKCLVQ